MRPCSFRIVDSAGLQSCRFHPTGTRANPWWSISHLRKKSSSTFNSVSVRTLANSSPRRSPECCPIDWQNGESRTWAATANSPNFPTHCYASVPSKSTTGRFFPVAPRVTVRQKSPSVESTPRGYRKRPWRAEVSRGCISSERSWTSPAGSADIISNGPGLQDSRPEITPNAQLGRRIADVEIYSEALKGSTDSRSHPSREAAA